MELSCESLRYSEDRRPASCKFVELHVLYVPDDQWDAKLNKVPAEAIENFISAGFIRVYPDVTLKTLRSELGALLGTERSLDRFSFLKCVGRSLALVKSKQERDLKVKTFAPPYAPQPELYLLPIVETDGSICSQSFTPDTSSSFPDHHIYYQPSKTCSLPTGTKEPVKFPLMAQCSHQPPPTSSLEEEEEKKEDEDEERGEDEARSYSGSEGEENEEEGLSSNKPEWAPQAVLRNKTALQGHKADLPPSNEETCREKPNCGGNQAARDSGLAESLVERDSDFRHRKSNKILKSTRSKTTAMMGSPAVPPQPVHCSPQPPGMDSESQNTYASFGSQTTRENLIEEIKLVRDERKQLECTRQELLRKGKELLALNRHRRNQARDNWKKKYFETKKATAPLEDNLRNLRLELETFYNKLLHQLQARDRERGKPRQQGRPSIKNELIIQIMTQSHEIDNLKRKMEDAKMKLVTEIKLRKQAATELRALKVELAQKKSQSAHAGPTACLSYGKTT